MIVGRKGAGGGHLARQQPRGQRHAGDHSHICGLGCGQERIRGALAKKVVDDLHRHNAGVADGLYRLVNLFYRHAIGRDFAFGFQRFHRVIDHGAGVNRCRRAVQLHQIKAVHLQIGAAAIDEGFKVGQGIALGLMRVQAATGFGGDKGARGVWAAFGQHGGDQAFRPAIAVDIRGIKEIDAGIQRGVQRGFGVSLAHLAPSAANGPSAKADGGGLKASFAKTAGGKGHGSSPVARHT